MNIPIVYEGRKTLNAYKYPLPDYLNIQLNAKGWDLLKIKNQIRLDSFAINLNSFNKSRIITNKELKENLKVFLPNKISITYIEPDTIHLEEDIFEKKIVPVKSKIELKTAPGFGLYDQIHITPSIVEIYGPKSILNTINFIHTKDTILNNISLDTALNLELNINPKLNLRCKNKTVHIFLPIAHLTEKSIRIPIKIENVDANRRLNIVPSFVTIYYQTPINMLESLQADQFEISVPFQKRDSEGYVQIQLVNKPQFVIKCRIVPSKIGIFEFKEITKK